jgi:outer membrane protein OmpA-like peptidoglycan-associated protein
MLRHIIVLSVAAALVACGLPSNVVVLVPDDGGTVGKVVVTEDNTQRELSNSYAAVDTGSGAQSAQAFAADRGVVEAVFARALAATPRPAATYVIFFVLGQAEVAPRSTGMLAAAIEGIHSTPNADISVVGHTDAIGDENANLALSLRRAQVVRDALIKGGVPPAEIEIGYHGSNNPRIPTPPGVPEPENRRVEVTVR